MNSISKYSKTEGLKTRHYKMGKVIHEELCKGFNFEHSTSEQMQKPESNLQNETHKNLRYKQIT